MEKRTPDKSPTHAIITATRAMIVCEQAYTRRLIADVLYSMGVGKVALFDDPHRAIDSMAQFRPTLLVANWDAPSQEGLELPNLSAMRPRFQPRGYLIQPFRLSWWAVNNGAGTLMKPNARG